MKSSDIHIRAILHEMPQSSITKIYEMPQPSITKICLKITCLKFHSNFPGANEWTLDTKIIQHVTCWPILGLQYRYFLFLVKSLQPISYYSDVIMGALASQITSLTTVYSTVYSDADQRKHQSSASLAFVRGFHRGPVNSPHKWPVTRKMFPFDDVIMIYS